MKSRASVYSKIWDVLYDLEGSLPSVLQPASKSRKTKAILTSGDKAISYGGVLVDKHRRVMLRRPKDDFDGYVWTFPKRRASPGETPEQTALREVQEETGYSAAVVRELSGSFVGGTSVTKFFLLTSIDPPSAFDGETSAIKWATFDEAVKLIGMTTNKIGKTRDLSVLEAVRTELKSQSQP